MKQLDNGDWTFKTFGNPLWDALRAQVAIAFISPHDFEFSFFGEMRNAIVTRMAEDVRIR